MRLLMGILAGRPGEVTLRGDESLSRRPMRRVAEPLRLMGANVELAGDGTPPVGIKGAALHGIRYELPVASAQVKSAVLLAGLLAEGRTTVVEPVRTRDHTERLLGFLGAAVQVDGDAISVEAASLFGDKEINVPGDFSSASFLLTAAAITDGSDVTVADVGLNPTRTAFLQVLERFGAQVETGGLVELSGEPRGWVRVRAGDRRPPWVEPHEIPACIDELPLVAVLGAAAAGTTELRGAGELRVKESDRVATIVDGLVRMGVRARALPDGFVIDGGPIEGGVVDSHGDHRIAMALAVAGLAARGATTVRGWGAVGVSYPEFERDLQRLTRIG
jgi:3-phosphoshikimate 1-carboxyvinyltransferase